MTNQRRIGNVISDQLITSFIYAVNNTKIMTYFRH